MFTKALTHKLHYGITRFLVTVVIFLCLSAAGAGLTYWASSSEQRHCLEHFFSQLLEGKLPWSSIYALFNTPKSPDEPTRETTNLPIKKAEQIHENPRLTAKLTAPSHGIPTDQRVSNCRRKPAVSIKKQHVYQWKDAQGRTHFSDQAPQDRNNSSIRSKSFDSNDRFTLNLDSQYAALPAFAADRIKRDVNTVYRVLVSDWALKNVQPIQLNLKLFDSKSAFNRYKDKVAPMLGTAGGFYIHGLREASVLTYGNSDRMYSVTRHEATHAINHNAFGVMPTWLNEGRAEYFEGLSFQYGSHALNTPNKSHLRLLTQSPLPSLSNYLQLNGRDWYTEEQKSLNYAIAWSLVYFLLSTPEGEVFFKGVLNQLSDNYCEGINTRQFINQHYAGGVKTLNMDWLRFLRKEMPIHYY